MDTTRDYVHRLEAHLQMMSQRMESLQAELAAANDRNRALAFTQGQAAQEQRRTTEREALRRAEAIVTEAERRVAATVAESERRAREVESRAQQRAEQMIAAVNLQLDQLEGQAAQELQAAQQRQSQGMPAPEAPTSTPAQAEVAPSGTAETETARAAEALAVAEAADTERTEIRRQVNELLRLRETVLLTIRQAIDGFQTEIGQLEGAPLTEPEEARAPTAGDSGDAEPTDPAAPAPSAAGPRVELVVEPVGGFERATGLEAELAELEGASEVRLRSLEDGVATFEIRGLSADRAAPLTAARFPDSEVEAAADGGLRLRLRDPSAEGKGS